MHKPRKSKGRGVNEIDRWNTSKKEKGHNLETIDKSEANIRSCYQDKLIRKFDTSYPYKSL